MHEILKLYNTPNIKKYSRFVSMFKQAGLLYTEAKNILPDSIYNDYCKDIKEDIRLVKDIDKSCYVKRFKENQKIFDNLSSAAIDKLAFLAIKEIEKNNTLLMTLNSFKPANGFAKKANYMQTETITGRLIDEKQACKSLTLPSRYRRIFKSRWGKEGKLFQIDFNNLEPRLIRKINNQNCSLDIYEDVKSMLSFDIDRSLIKKAIISILYGQKRRIENIVDEKNTEIFNVISNYFELDNLKKYLDISEFNCRFNFFGRPIWNAEELGANKVLNNFIQSSAVDVALNYFSLLTTQLDLEKAKFLFIIHDALIVDIHNDYEKEFVNIASKGYNCSKLKHFPVTIEVLN